MKTFLQSIILLLFALIIPTKAAAISVQLAEGVYQDGSTLYIGSEVTSLGGLSINPSTIYCYAQIPPSCLSNTFSGYNAALHVPASAMATYFSAQYWYNFNNVIADAVEPQGLSLNRESLELEIGDTFSLTTSVVPSNATYAAVSWSSTNTAVATVNGGKVRAVAEGECDIIASCAALQVTCHVIVASVSISIKLDLHDASILPNHLLTLTYTCAPTYTDLVAFSSDNSVVMPRIVNGNIQVLGLKEGTATITVESVDGTAHTDSCEVTVFTEYGDVDCDGSVTISDVTRLIDFLLSGNPEGVNIDKADTDRDGKVNISDVTELIDYLLGGVDINPPKKETFTVNGVSFNMIEVVGGMFRMGGTSEQGGDAASWEYPTHDVILSGYFIGETEVTQALWKAVMGNNPSNFKGDNRPVENVSWNDCQTFISRLNQITGILFRLPTEAEWEFAARGGNKSKGYKFSGSHDINKVAWYWDPADTEGNGDITHIVASKAPNELGIYDMSGNVSEVCQDYYGNYNNYLQTNPAGLDTSAYRPMRGGSCGYSWSTSHYDQASAMGCRVSSRKGQFPDGKGKFQGFRLALDLKQNTMFCLSETNISIEVEESITVNILQGHGSYTLSGGEEYVDITVNDSCLTLTGKAVGSAIVYITDDITNKQASITVTVTEQAQEFTANGVSFKMIPIKGGTFLMGATEEQGEDAAEDEYPVHQVTLSDYMIGQTEVTQELWVAVMGTNPSRFSGHMDRPVENLSWSNCQTFIYRLNQLTGMAFRLPTEAEWEYAARGGCKSKGYKYAGSNDLDEIAWYGVTGGDWLNPKYGTHTVGSLMPNELRLYDMTGNVWEWCQDKYGEYSGEAQTNPTGAESGSYIHRGGAWDISASQCRVSYRKMCTLYTSFYIGLRLAL